MSVPHTGHLVAEIYGERYEFDGDLWKGPKIDLVARLNMETSETRKTHSDIRELALRVWYRLPLAEGVEARIIDWSGDTWPDDNPDDAID